MKTISTKSLMRVLALVVLVAIPSVSRADVLRGDANGDGKVNITDVTALINYLLKGVWPDEPVIPADGHDWVDLGLPSGTLWATCNLGADRPEDFGDYFAWGETAPKDYYDWSTYKWCNGSDYKLTKYCTDSNNGYNGFTDGKIELDPEDDAAYINWGPSWRMPTTEQQQELFDKCSLVWATQDGVNGLLVTGPNGNTMFLPAAGIHWYESLDLVDTHGNYWSRTLYSSGCFSSFFLVFHCGNSDEWGCHLNGREYGHSVRAVRVP